MIPDPADRHALLSSHIGTLPPIRGMSMVCQELVSSLSKLTDIEFIGFSKLYPNFLYPGGETTDTTYRAESFENVSVRNILTYYNPFSWMRAGLTIKGAIVHAQWWSHVLAPAYYVVLALCKVRGKKIVITVHNVLPHENSRMNKFLNGIVLRWGDRFIVHSHRNVGELHAIYHIPEERVAMIPLGTLTNYRDEVVSQERAREHLDLPQHGKIILFPGNIREYKGLDVLLEAMPRIRDQCESVILMIAGLPWKNWGVYEEQISQYFLDDNVRLFLHYIPSNELKYYYYASDLVVLPYKEFMSQSGVGSLALVFEKPLIVTDVGGLPDFVKDTRSVVRPNDPGALAERITMVLQDDALKRRLAQDSKELAEVFSWDRIAMETLKLYYSLLKPGMTA